MTTIDEHVPHNGSGDESSEISATDLTTHLAAVQSNVEQVIQGKRDVVHLLVLALVCEGHVLIEDVPGVGKTTLAKALARSVNGRFGRVQFTPDLLPSDVTGMSVWNRATSTFDFRPGPVFADILLADEINRASPKTQSALLEAMAERQVTTDGATHPLGSSFMVIATQNPIEHEGTYPLPEAQLDRFLMRIGVGYPQRDSERLMLATHAGTGDGAEALQPVTSAETMAAVSEAITKIHIAPPLAEYLLDLADATRRHRSLALGLSPRGLLDLQRAARAQAASQGRAFVIPDDVKALAPFVIPHRLIVSPEGTLRGIRPSDVLAEILDGVPVPRPEAR